VRIVFIKRYVTLDFANTFFTRSNYLAHSTTCIGSLLWYFNDISFPKNIIINATQTKREPHTPT